jgi:hypothetical protein
LKYEGKRRSGLNASFSSEKATSTDHDDLKSPPLFGPISYAIDSVTWLFPDSSGRCSLAASLTLPDQFNSLRLPHGCPFSRIDQFTFAANSSSNIWLLTAANSSYY